MIEYSRFECHPDLKTYFIQHLRINQVTTNGPEAVGTTSAELGASKKKRIIIKINKYIKFAINRNFRIKHTVINMLGVTNAIVRS